MIHRISLLAIAVITALPGLLSSPASANCWWNDHTRNVTCGSHGAYEFYPDWHSARVAERRHQLEYKKRQVENGKIRERDSWEAWQRSQERPVPWYGRTRDERSYYNTFGVEGLARCMDHGMLVYSHVPC